MKRPLPAMSMMPPCVPTVPETVHLGQNAWRMDPHGFLGSVPKVEVPFVPATKPGVVLVNVRSTTVDLCVVDLILYEVPSGESSTEQPSAKKETLSLSKRWLSRRSVAHAGGFPSVKNTFELNWHVVRMPLNSQLSHDRRAMRQLCRLTPHCYI